jgi:deoxyribodipyrimidine photolyase-related protein
MHSATLVFPHQLYKDHPAIAQGRRVVLVEEFLYFSYYRFHKQKLVLHRAGMKTYAAELEKKGFTVEYIEAAATHSDVRRLGSYLASKKITEVHYAGLSDDWLQRRLAKTLEANSITPVVYETPNFITLQKDAEAFFATGKGYFQTAFYIWQRKRFKILLQPGGEPVGGQWSFDEDNRSPFPKGEAVPELCFPEQDATVKEAIAYVEKHWPHHYGDLNHFRYPVTHARAEKWLNEFLKNRFEKFGVYEDAMVAKEHYLYHSVLTPMLNTGLLNPKQVINAAVKIARTNAIPLNSVEGFIRQIIGWREFVHAVYEREGRKQRTRNYWLFTRPIPRQFWTGETGILPIDTVIQKILKTGYSHHIERLMVLGNFMLLCEFNPDEVYRWFMEMYIDAYDWVMVPNTYGMTQFSDGGLMMTKPYISGSNYLMKMGDWAKGPWQQTWDGLFWRFMHVHRQFFLQNPRLRMLVHSLDKMDAAKREQHLANGEAFLQQLDKWNA